MPDRAVRHPSTQRLDFLPRGAIHTKHVVWKRRGSSRSLLFLAAPVCCQLACHSHVQTYRRCLRSWMHILIASACMVKLKFYCEYNYTLTKSCARHVPVIFRDFGRETQTVRGPFTLKRRRCKMGGGTESDMQTSEKKVVLAPPVRGLASLLQRGKRARD